MVFLQWINYKLWVELCIQLVCMCWKTSLFHSSWWYKHCTYNTLTIICCSCFLFESSSWATKPNFDLADSSSYRHKIEECGIISNKLWDSLTTTLEQRQKWTLFLDHVISFANRIHIWKILEVMYLVKKPKIISTNDKPHIDPILIQYLLLLLLNYPISMLLVIHT